MDCRNIVNYLSNPKIKSSKTLIFALLPMLFVGLACSRLTALKANMFEGNNTEKAVAEIKNKIGKPFNITEIVIEKSELRVHAQDPNNPKNLDEYKYVGGFVSGPNPVKLNAMNDKLEQSSFPLDEINFAAVPQIIADALKQTAVEGGQVKKMTFQRGFAIVGNSAGGLGTARWNIEVVGTRENASAAANPDGKVVGVNLSQTSRGADYRATTKEELQKAQDAIKKAFGADSKIYEFSIYEKFLMFSVPTAKNPKIMDGYKFDINGLAKDGIPDLGRTPMTMTFRELFAVGDLNLPDIADYIEKTKKRLELPNGTVSFISVQREQKGVYNKEFRTIIKVSLQSGTDEGSVSYNNQGGAEATVSKNGEYILKEDTL